MTEPLGPLLEQHQRNIETIRTKARLEGRSRSSTSPTRRPRPFNKFISYYLFPEARYSVGVTLSARAKISIGANPWSKVPRTHEINKICERYGGGGHPVVGAHLHPTRRVAPGARDRPRHRRRAEQLARTLTPTLSRKREREKDQIWSPLPLAGEG